MECVILLSNSSLSLLTCTTSRWHLHPVWIADESILKVAQLDLCGSKWFVLDLVYQEAAASECCCSQGAFINSSRESHKGEEEEKIVACTRGWGWEVMNLMELKLKRWERSERGIYVNLSTNWVTVWLINSNPVGQAILHKIVWSISGNGKSMATRTWSFIFRQLGLNQWRGWCGSIGAERSQH